MKAMLGCAGILIAVALAAEGLGRREEIYGGAAGGLLLGLIGLGFAWKIRGRYRQAHDKTTAAGHAQERGAAKPGGMDVMGLWGAGMLCRLVTLGLLALLYGWWLGEGHKAALLATAAVYLVLMVWETAWLMQAFTRRKPVKPNEAENG